jgi:O-antigen ligase
MFGIHLGGSSVTDGSPVDAAFYFVLIVAGLCVLYQRRVGCVAFIQNNRWLTLYLAYCLLAVLWSDFPFIAFKRWIKLFGQAIVVLIVFTEPDPKEAFIRLMKRVAYVLIPLSILLIKYFPAFGRGYEPTGAPFNGGVTTNKNELGFDCLIFGFFFFWHLLQVRQRENGRAKRNELILCAGFLTMIFWLTKMAHSATSLVSLLVAMAVVSFLGLRFVSKKNIGVYFASAIVLVLLAQFAFGIFDDIIEMLGRNTTLTGRTDLWKILIHWNINPLIGTGFESFWLGDRLKKMAEIYWWGPNEAHNGYLETYLNLGIIGLLATAGMVLAAYNRARRELLTDFEFARFRLAYLVAFLIYNWTEAAFRTLSFPFIMFFLIAVNCPKQIETATEEEFQSGENGIFSAETAGFSRSQ